MKVAATALTLFRASLVPGNSESPRRPVPGSAREHLLARLRQDEPDRAEALSRRLDEDRTLIRQMDQMRKNARLAPKADAAQRVARIKEEIRLLQAMGGDPKQIARRLAQLARELAQAARAYAAASGAGAAAAATDDGGSGAVAGGDKGAAAPVAADVNTVAQSSPGVVDRDAARAKLFGAGGQDEEGRRSRLDALRETFRENAERTEDAEADRRFRDEVRALIAKLRELARKAAQRMRDEGETDARATAASQQGLGEAEQAAARIATVNGYPAVSVFA